jgi:hypothetical protein
MTAMTQRLPRGTSRLLRLAHGRSLPVWLSSGQQRKCEGKRRCRRSGGASPIFANLRDESNLEGKCGCCEFSKVCMGLPRPRLRIHAELPRGGAELRLHAAANAAA